jgi:ubiquinone/menaquinone biosynthesis C-methylase UbiE
MAYQSTGQKETEMTTGLRIHSSQQILAWGLAGLFILGFFFSPVGAWTGPIIGVWFVGTQKPFRGFIWMMAIAFIPSLLMHVRSFPLTGPALVIEYAGWLLLAALLSVLPFTFHRFASPHISGLLSTLPLPLAATALVILNPPPPFGAHSGTSIHHFLLLWLAAVVVWMWYRELSWTRIGTAVSLFAVFLVLDSEFLAHSRSLLNAPGMDLGSTFAWTCLAGCCAFLVYALLHPFQTQPWASRPQALARLQSPFTGAPFQAVAEQGREALAFATGEHFTIRNGIPDFRAPQDLTGYNLKYNRVYQTIGGFYDDIQRIFCALAGFDRNAYFRSYMHLLQVKPGDSVLETSVGTGLNFKYLPAGVAPSGLDLSPEMLANCQLNLRRWQMDADLYLGNAESLPFADSSFDVVFHVGGINFFNDRAKAIREMIRVAKPGSLLLIADETEKHVREVYEKSPGGLWKNRKTPVSAPIDLVPPEMQEVRLQQMRNGDTYALTFRKPAIL